MKRGAVGGADEMSVTGAGAGGRFAWLVDTDAEADDVREVGARDGVVLARGLVPPARVEALRGVVLDFAREAGWLDEAAEPGQAAARPGMRVGAYDDPAWVRLQAHVQGRPEFWALGREPAVRRLVGALAPPDEEPYLSLANTVRAFSPHADLTTRAHQDGHFVRDLGEFWTVWLPLGECPFELGPLAVVPGSHRAGPLAHDDAGEVAEGGLHPWHTADFRSGDALAFHCRTLHRALPNRSGTLLRLSADFRYGFGDTGVRADVLQGPLQGPGLPDTRGGSPARLVPLGSGDQ